MTESVRKKILVIEDAKGIAKGYETILKQLGHDITTCHDGTEVQSLTYKGNKFDLAIVDIILPTEDSEKYTLAECQETGLRLIRRMIEKDTCRRFYVITVRSTLRDRLELLCQERKVALTFEHKLDYDPEKFQENIEALLAQSSDSNGKNLLIELTEHIDILDGYAKMINLLDKSDEEQVTSSMKSIQKISAKSTNRSFENILNRAKSVLREDYLPKMQGVLKKETERTIAAIEHWLKQRT